MSTDDTTDKPKAGKRKGWKRNPKNPADVFFWNDIERDECLSVCSLAAQGLWACRLLPIAARSPERGVVIIGTWPCRADGDLPIVLANKCGGSPDVMRALLDELINSGAASLDDQGRIFNRRMRREAEVSKRRSEAGKLGADATNAGRQNVGKQGGKQGGKQVGKTDPAQDAPTPCAEGPITDDPEKVERQNSGKAVGKTAASSSFQPFMASKDESEIPSPSSTFVDASGADPGEPQPNLPIEGGSARAPRRSSAAAQAKAVLDAWNETAERVNAELGRGEFQIAQKLTDKRQRLALARLADVGGIDGVRACFERWSRDRWARGETPRKPEHAGWRIGLDYALSESAFTKIMERNDDSDAAEAARRQQQSHRRDDDHEARAQAILGAKAW